MSNPWYQTFIEGKLKRGKQVSNNLACEHLEHLPAKLSNYRMIRQKLMYQRGTLISQISYALHFFYNFQCSQDDKIESISDMNGML